MRFLRSPVPQRTMQAKGRSYVIRRSVAGTPCEAPSVPAAFRAFSSRSPNACPAAGRSAIPEPSS